MVTARPSEEWRRGWRIVAGAAVGMGTGVSLYVLLMSIFVTHITRAFGWSRGEMGIAGMVAFVSGALTMPLVGRLVDRFGFRPIVLVCVPGLALVYLLIALQPGYYPFHLVLAVFGGLFGGGTAAITYTRPVIAAFERQRGLALGVATAGTSVTAILVPPALAAVIVAYGWRAGLYALAALTALVGLPLALGLIGGGREDAPPRSDSPSESAWRVVDANVAPEATLGQAVRSARFWLLAGALVAVNIPGSGVVSQLAPLIGDKGLPEQAVALVMSVYSAGLLVGRLVTGLSLDRLPAPAVGAVMTFIPAVGIVLLRASSTSFIVSAAAVAMIGLQQGSEVDLIAYFVSRAFGRKHYGAVYGAVAMAGALSTAFALVFFGRVHDITGSYDVALRVGAVAFCLGAVAFMAMGLARKPI